MRPQLLRFLYTLLVWAFLTNHSSAFTPVPHTSQTRSRLHVLASTNNKNNQDNTSSSLKSMTDNDQLWLGVAGTTASLVTLYSEYTLKTTGCGLPAGPFGLIGAVEGISYLGIVVLASYSLVQKVKTGSGLPAGPAGILGAAEGLAFLAIVVGLVVLGFQIVDYGYIPNAVPMEGGMCS